MSERTAPDLAKSLYKSPEAMEPEDVTRQVELMAGKSKLQIEKEEKPESPKPISYAKEDLEKWVGKVFERIAPGIYVGAKYTVKELLFSERKSAFVVERDSPLTEYEIACAEFCPKMIEVGTRKIDKPTEPAKPKKAKTPWSE